MPLISAQRDQQTMPITLLDFVLIGVMLISGLLAMVRGFMREVLSIVAWVSGGRLRPSMRIPSSCRSRSTISINDIVAAVCRDRRNFSAHAADCLDINRADFRHGARQPRRRARSHTRLPVRAWRGLVIVVVALHVLQLARSAIQPAGMGTGGQIQGCVSPGPDNG